MPPELTLSNKRATEVRLVLTIALAAAASSIVLRGVLSVSYRGTWCRSAMGDKQFINMPQPGMREHSGAGETNNEGPRKKSSGKNTSNRGTVANSIQDAHTGDMCICGVTIQLRYPDAGKIPTNRLIYLTPGRI